MPPRSEVLGHRTIRGQEPLGVPGRLEPLHPPLPLARGLMRILCAVIEVAVLAMFHTGEHLPLRGPIALQLIGDDRPWDILAAFELDFGPFAPLTGV
jgi:hypothetical protein